MKKDKKKSSQKNANATEEKPLLPATKRDKGDPPLNTNKIYLKRQTDEITDQKLKTEKWNDEKRIRVISKIETENCCMAQRLMIPRVHNSQTLE